MEDIDIDQLLNKLRSGNYKVDEEGRVLEEGFLGSTPTGLSIDLKSGRIEKEGLFGDTPTGFKINPDTGRVERESFFGDTPIGFRVDPETGRIEKEGFFGNTPTGLRFDPKTGEIKKEGCWITTACCQARGLPDDCTELHELRNFRDYYVRRVPGGAELLSEYYQLAPVMVSRIEKLPNAKILYERLFEGVLLTALELIRQDRKAEALRHLVGEFEKLKQELVPRGV